MKNMNPLKSNNIVARILQVYAYVNAAAGFILTLLINKELELDAVVLSIILASVLVVNFLIFALGEIIDLLQNLKDNTDKKAEIPGIRGTENTPVKSAQPTAVVSQSGSYNLNNHMSQQNYDPREKEKRVAAYWAEHTAEKAALEAELESVNNKLTDLQAQIDAVSKEVSPQIAALNKKRTEKIPEEIEVAKQRALIHELEKARADLGGLFKSKERDAITERLNTIERPKLDRLSQECEIAKQKNKSCIDAEIAALNRPELRYEKENLKKRQAEIKRELARDRL